MLVHNLMEEVVKQCLNEMLITQEQLRDCDENVKSDIMALTLNNLPPKYVSSSQGEVFVKTQMRLLEPEVYRELSHAIEKVLNTGRKTRFSVEEE
jgi:competence protein ComFB